MPVIFISYRRSDSQDVTGRIYDRLVAKFTKRQVFKDVDNIPLGVSFPLHIQQRLGKADVVLVIIGPRWLSATDAEGYLRLDDPGDFVRLEVEGALRANMPVIPVLVSNARMPLAKELPPSLRGLVARNGMAVRPDPDFNNDIERLFSGIEHLQKLLGGQAGKKGPANKGGISSVLRVADKNPSGKLAALARKAPTKPKLGQARPGKKRSRAWLRALLVVLLLAGGVAALRQSGGLLRREKTDPKVHKPAQPSLVTNALGMRFTWCPPGSFTMGSPLDEEGRGADETQHRVTLTKGFYLGVHPVTQGQWQAVMGSNPSHFKEADRPVEMVLWPECAEFCKRLGQRDGKRYRLPTEAEWEYACRAGTTTAYHTGNGLEAMKRAGWCSYDGKQESAKETKPVGQFEPNAWGLLDMHGNVYQWCADQYAPYPKEEVTDPSKDQDINDPVLRGGSWFDGPAQCRSAYRFHGFNGTRYTNIGCRVILCQD